MFLFQISKAKMVPNFFKKEPLAPVFRLKYNFIFDTSINYRNFGRLFSPNSYQKVNERNNHRAIIFFAVQK